MNIAPSYPNINLNTANVYTETARRDNQLREVIPPARQAESIRPEAKVASETDRHKQQTLNSEQSQELRHSEQQNSKKINSGDSQQQDEHQEKGSEQNRRQLEQELTEAEQKQVKQLKARDAEVRAHEQAHAAVGGQYAGSPSYEYERGPDGSNYAVAGEVPIDVSEVAGDPQATIDKMEQVKAAALAPAEPSSTDRAIAAQAQQQIVESRAELIQDINEQEPNDEQAATEKVEQSAADSENSDHQSAVAGQKRAYLAQRDDEINQRAERIAHFYHAATSPLENSVLIGQI